MRRAFVPVLLFALGACSSEEIDPSTTDQQIAGDISNGDNLNGDNLNGTGLGNALAWASFKNVRIGSVHLDDLWLDGSQLVGMRRHGHHRRIFRGHELEGARLKGRTDTGHPLKLRIAEVVPPTGANDIWHYAIEFKNQGAWIPMCLADALTGDGLNGPFLNGDELNEAIENGDIDWLPAIPVDGYWDYRQGVPGGGDKIEQGDRFTFACPQIGAIGKCVEAGYEPWANGTDGAALASEHEACVRLIRADYCGDGTPHTISGTIVNLYDAVGVQDDTEAWQLEAEWDKDGARCITSHIRQANPVDCVERLFEEDCGDPVGWSSGTLLVSETP